MNEREILEQTRMMIAECAGSDPDRLWYVNRFVFARLQLDERRTKAGIKKELFESGAICHGCKQPFASRGGVHLHRLDSSKAYSAPNCVLMHEDCHRSVGVTGQGNVQADEQRVQASAAHTDDTSVTKWSQSYEGRPVPYLYWWDISPGGARGIAEAGSVAFGKRDSREICLVPYSELAYYLIPERQTARGQGNWGVKILADRPDELAFEPGVGRNDWKFHPVVWLDNIED